MSTNITFDSLQSDVRKYLERGGSVITDPEVYSQIPRLVNAAERKLCQSLKLLGMLEVLVDPTGLGINQPVISKPDRWRSTVSINFGGGIDNEERTPLYPRGYEYARRYWPNQKLLGTPKYYADYDQNHWLIVPTPDANYPAEFNCYMQPPLLDDGNQENFFTIFCGNCLLYGTLLEASPFLKNDERVPLWQNLWDRDFATLSGQDLQRILDRSAQRASN